MLLSITLSNNQTLYQFLRATKTPLAIVAEPDKLNELLTSYGLESLEQIVQNQLKKMTSIFSQKNNSKTRKTNST